MIIESILPIITESYPIQIDIRGWRKASLVSTEYLLESLDYTPTLTDVTHEFEPPRHLKNFRVHRSETGDHILSFEKDNATEIHHAAPNDESGHILRTNDGSPLNKSPNVKFVSTMFSMAKGFVSQGKRVRISATGELINKYHSIAKTLKKRHGFDVSELSDKNEFYISPSIISEAIEILHENRIKN